MNPTGHRPSIIAFLVVALAACGGDGTDADPLVGAADASGAAPGDAAVDGQVPSSVSFAADVQPAFDEWCVRCHFYGGPLPTLSTGFAHEELMGQSTEPCRDGAALPYVVPGDPDASYLHFKLTGERSFRVEPGCALLMPLDQPGPPDGPLAELDADAVAIVRAWIAGGAKDD